MAVDAVGDAAHLGGLVEPPLALVGVLRGECLEGIEDGGVALLYVGVCALEAFLHLSEAVEHVARHVEGQHGGEDDIHEVYHLLSR